MLEPLLITAYMQSPVAGDFSLPLDAILYYQAHREVLGPQVATVPGAHVAEGVGSAALPIAKQRVIRDGKRSREWFYRASWARWPLATEGIDHWNCRFDFQLESLVDFGGRKARVEIGSGRYRSYHQPIFYRHAVAIEWCVVGDCAAIERLLSCCTHIGKKVSQGWGSVLKWMVEPTADDWSVRDSAGRPTRAIPSDGGILSGYRPSYWSPRNQALCELPDNAAEQHLIDLEGEDEGRIASQRKEREQAKG